MNVINFLSVSIQLISPASGDKINVEDKELYVKVEFPFN